MDAFLITFAVLFPFGWIIYGLIRLTAKAFGDESPRMIRVSYTITERQYFTRYTFIELLLLTVFFLFLVFSFSFLTVRETLPVRTILVVLALVASLLYGLWYMRLCFQLERQYWSITRNKTITLEPADQSLTITTDDETLYITADLIDEIERHGPGLQSSKMMAGYSYLLFKLKDGQTACLNFNSVYLSSALDHYFKSVPIRYIPHKIPWISEP